MNRAGEVAVVYRTTGAVTSGLPAHPVCAASALPLTFDGSM